VTKWSAVNTAQTENGWNATVKRNKQQSR